ncbi:MAG: hypothetical protein Kow0074_19960 [Candidatus Zixiibacteriota bacterium]
MAVTEARIDPGQGLHPDAQLLPMIARGLDKGAVQAPTALTEGPTYIQGGVSRTGATFCDGQWQGGIAFFIGGWLYGDEFYATYQDPEELGSCAGNNDVYTFDVTAINWILYRGQSGYAGLLHLQPIVYENAGDISCAVPGNVLCAGPLYEFDLAGAAGNVLGFSLPLDTECCVFDPYFGGAYFADFLGPDVIDVITDDGSGGLPACHVYNDYGSGWVDLNIDIGFPGNLSLSSEGNAFDQNNCPGTPGICDYQAWYDGVAFFWQSPNGNGQDDYFTRYTADVSCTLQTFRFMAYCPGTEATEPTYRVSLFGSNGPVFGGRMYPQAFGVPFDPLDPNHIETIELPFGSYNCFPDWTVVDFTDYAFGPGQDIIISVGLSANTPDPGTDIISVLTDDGGTPQGRSGSYVGVLSDWFYNDEVFSSDYDLMYEAFICCEQVEAQEVACAAPGPDDWNTFAHDYARTSATSIEVGDPCQINPVWFADQPQNVNFTQATVAEDRVYISSDQRSAVYDLTTGALINTISGLPHIFASNRGNITVDGGAAWVTGGSAQSIGKWDLDLSTNAWVNGVGGTNPPLGASVRFGAATYISSLDIVIIGSENAQLWAFNGADGTLFGGWSTNPITLDANVLHGAAFDGTDIFVGTADASLANGSIYSFDAATGTMNWNFVSGNLDGFPAGVSLDGADLYASSSGIGTNGFRYKLDKATGAVIWSFSQQRTLYGAPAIGRNFVYCNLDGLDAGGVFMIDKNSGAPVKNFAEDGVFMVPQHVTITCDNYMFAGDRNGKWWLLDLVNLNAVWQIEAPFFSSMMGTAVASNVAGDRNFAIATYQFGGPTAGMIAAFEFNSGARPIVSQSVYATEIGVEFGTGAGNPYTEPDVFTNLGCADLNFSSFNIYDPAPDVAASPYSNVQSQMAAAIANRSLDANLNTYFETGKVNKTQRLLMEPVNEESFRFEEKLANLRADMKSTTTKRDNTRMAAGSSIIRTSGVTVTNPLPAGATTDVDWLYDGTNLQRGVDVEIIEFITDDPDRVLFGNQPQLQVTYAGGCFPASAAIEWNTLDVTRFELMYNDGQLGDDDEGDDTDWDGTGSQDVYDAGIYLAGEWDSTVVPPIAQFHQANVYDNYDLEFLPDPFPGPSCDFQGATDVLMGYKREGGCPGTPTEIRGAWLRTAYVDTNLARVGTFGEAIGTRIVATEVGAYDPLYGDFKLYRYEVTNRDGFDKGPIYLGSFHDWDVRPNFASNTGFLGLSYNGYGIYDFNTPELAFGMFDPNLPTDYTGLNTAHNAPQRISSFGEGDGTGAVVGLYDGPWQSGQDADPWEELWDVTVARTPQYEDGPYDLVAHPSEVQDCGGILTLKGQILPANGTVYFHQAVYAVDASSGDENTMEALGLALAQRAAKWAGFARGDVNDDNTVNLLDVCWLLSGHQIYPDTYNGDVDLSGVVDAADEAYLLNYVTGLGPAPLGEWRFTF